MKAVVEALALLTPFDVDKPKVRVGPDADGGYVFIDDMTPDQTVLSYGISTEYGLDQEFARRGHDVYMFDHTIAGVNASHERMKFYREGVAGVSDPKRNVYSIEDHLRKHQIHGDRLILKMDVEGAEFDALIMISEPTLCRFEQIVLELHNLSALGGNHYRGRFVAMLSILNAYFTLFHVHANNHDGPDALAAVAGCPVSDLLELSYIRTTAIKRRPSQTLYPTEFDFPNTPKRDKLLWFYPFLPTSLTVGDFVACENRVALLSPLQMKAVPRHGKNVALNKAASQSSLSQYSREADAQRAVAGVVTGRFGFHTQKDHRPWWQVDLGEAFPLKEVLVFNRLDAFNRLGAMSARAYDFVLKIGIQPDIWEEVYAQKGRPFGGADGNPARIELGGKVARFVRVELPGQEYLHLDQVEVYAEEPPSPKSEE